MNWYLQYVHPKLFFNNIFPTTTQGLKVMAQHLLILRTLILASTSLLAACSSGDDSAAGGGNTNTTPVNAALMTNGAVAISSDNTLEKHYIHDGDITTTAWTASNAGDSITVMFSRNYAVTHFTLHLTSSAFSANDLNIATTADGWTFTTVNLVSDCSTLSMGSGQIACTFSSVKNISGIGITITAGTHAATTLPLYELIATGT